MGVCQCVTLPGAKCVTLPCWPPGHPFLVGVGNFMLHQMPGCHKCWLATASSLKCRPTAMSTADAPTSRKVAVKLGHCSCAADVRFCLCVHASRSLLSDMGARLWRVRQAASAALTDLLAGRRWAQLAPHMEQVRVGCWVGGCMLGVSV